MKKTWMISSFLFFSITASAMIEDEEIPMPPPPPMMESGAAMADFNGRSPAESVPAASFDVLSKERKDKIAKATVDEITDKNYPELIESFDFQNVEITEVIKAIGELTGKNFIVDPSVRGKITILAPTKITVAEAYKAFLSALAINGFTVVPGDGFYKIRSSRVAQKDNIETYSGEYFPNADQMITRIIHLKHISAEQVYRELRIFISKDGDLQAFNSTNSIIIADYGSTIDRLVKIINQLDVPGFEEKLSVLPVNNAKAKDMAVLINQIVNKDTGSGRSGGGGGNFSSGIPRFSGGGGPGSNNSGSGYFTVIPDERTNSLIVVGNAPGLARVKKLVQQLDYKIKAEEIGGVHVYYVKNGDAEKIAQTLSGVTRDNKALSSSGPGGGSLFMGGSVNNSSGLLGGDVKITADKDTNSLIITASRSDYDGILELLSKIDIPRDQVYVEAVILEMLLDDQGDWGLGYFKFNKESEGLGRQGFMPNNDLMSLGLLPGSGTGAIFSFAQGDIFDIKTPSGIFKVASMMGLLNVLKGTGRTNVLSTPQIMALDNEESEIEVGEDVAVGLTTTVSNGISQSTPQFKDATIKLKIKPFISPENETIRLKIDQRISQPELKAALPNTVTLSKRSVTTNIVVPDGDTAVLGGLVKDQEQESISKVPILGDIPIVGWLFKSRKISKKKAKLLICITPKIIRSSEDNHKLIDQKLMERLDFIKQTGGRDPYGKAIDQLPRKKKGSPSPRPFSTPLPSSPTSSSSKVSPHSSGSSLAPSSEARGGEAPIPSVTQRSWSDEASSRTTSPENGPDPLAPANEPPPVVDSQPLSAPIPTPNPILPQTPNGVLAPVAPPTPPPPPS